MVSGQPFKFGIIFLKNDLKQKEKAYLTSSVVAQIKYGERETMYENVGGGFTKPLHISSHAYVLRRLPLCHKRS